MTLSSLTAADIATRLAIIGGLFAVAKGIAHLIAVLMRWHETILSLVAEHDMLAEEYAVRHEITRYNMRRMATIMARNKRKANGHTDSSKGAGFHD